MSAHKRWLSMTPSERWRLGPSAADHYDRHPIDPGVSYALLRTQTRLMKPLVYPDLPALARRIHRERAGSAIELRDQRVAFRVGSELTWRRLVAVYGFGEGAYPTGFFGWAWLDGQGWKVLRDALYQLEPNPAGRAEAA